MAIYTRTGDKGTTALFGGSRVPKQDARVEAYGTVDEANAAIGLAKALAGHDELYERVHEVQNRLFSVAGELASDPDGSASIPNTISDADSAYLERIVDDCMAIVGPQKNFIIPGRDPISAQYHVARTIVRRAERRVLSAMEHHAIREDVVRYLNRLSDALYALARLYEHKADMQRVAEMVAKAVQDAQPGATDVEAIVAAVMESMAHANDVRFEA